MTKFLREHEVAEHFKAMSAAADEAFIAAPYWGKGALEMLSIHRGMPLRVICNLDQVGCNPDVIAELKALGIKVKTHRRLHAKIYGTAHAVIVGSSNVSSYGLTVDGREDAGWIEASLLSCEQGIIAAAHALFNELWKSPEARNVTKADIDAARSARTNSAFFAPPFDKTLLAACRTNPEAFANVYVAVYDSELSAEASRRLEEVKNIAQPPKKGLTASDFTKARGYQLGGIREGAWLLDLSCKRVGKYHGCSYSPGLSLKLKGDNRDLVITLRRPVEIGGRKFLVSAGEARILEENAHRILHKARGRVLPVRKVLRLIPEL